MKSLSRSDVKLNAEFDPFLKADGSPADSDQFLLHMQVILTQTANDTTIVIFGVGSEGRGPHIAERS
jgi:hypothetical protein